MQRARRCARQVSAVDCNPRLAEVTLLATNPSCAINHSQDFLSGILQLAYIALLRMQSIERPWQSENAKVVLCSDVVKSNRPAVLEYRYFGTVDPHGNVRGPISRRQECPVQQTRLDVVGTQAAGQDSDQFARGARRGPRYKNSHDGRKTRTHGNRGPQFMPIGSGEDLQLRTARPCRTGLRSGDEIQHPIAIVIQQ